MLLFMLLWSFYEMSKAKKRIDELEEILGIGPRKFYKKIGKDKWVRSLKEE